MKFQERFQLTDLANQKANSFASDLGVAAGVYAGGLITVLTEELSNVALADWRWLLGEDATALAATAVGDLFFWSERQSAVYFLEAQRGQSTYVDKDVRYFMDQFLPTEGVVEKILSSDAFAILSDRLGALEFGQCYIAQPWQILGGSGELETYQKGALEVYLSLVGQTVRKMMTSRSQA